MTSTIALSILPTAGNCLCGVALTTAQEIKDGLCAPCADAPCIADVSREVLIEFAMKKGRELDAQEAAYEQARMTLLPCGCYPDACYCGQYPTDAEMLTMEMEADATRPVPVPLTDAEMIEAEELRNFCDGRSDY